VDWVSLSFLPIKKGREAMRYAKIEPFMNIYIDPELFKFHDRSNNQNRYITLQEIAFVACRITTSALNNGYSTHLVSYNTFLTKWKDDYKTFSDLSPTRHKLVQIIKVLNKYNIIRQTKRGSNTPIYTIGVNNPYHPDYKPVKIKNHEVGYKAVCQQTQSPHLKYTPKRLQAESDALDIEFENILTNKKERN
jgi:hypothetical protein